MKKLNRVAIVAVAGLAVTGAGLARANQKSAPDLRSRTQQRVAAAMNDLSDGVRDLHLTKAQESRLHSLVKENLPAAGTIWTNDSLTLAQKREKLLALRVKANGVLTPEQAKKAETLRRVAVSTTLDNLSWVAEELDLSADQQDKLRDIAFHAAQKSAKLPMKDGKVEFGKLRALAAGTQGKIDAVLTPKQEGKWKVMRGVVYQEFRKRASDIQAFAS